MKKLMIMLSVIILTGFVWRTSNAGLFGDGWTQIQPPTGCIPKQIANSGGQLGTITVLCEERRIFER